MKRPAVVVDPLLFFSSLALPLVKALSEVVDVWLPRELWHVLKNSQLFSERPDLINLSGTFLTSTPEVTLIDSESVLQALEIWSAFYRHHDLSGMGLYWMGDRLSESLLPKRLHPSVFDQSEQLSTSLDRYLRPWLSVSDRDSTLVSAFRDAIALTTSLGTAAILTCQHASSPTPGKSFAFCRFYNAIGLTSREIPQEDLVAKREREYLQQMFIETGVAKLLWTNLEFSIIHLLSTNLTLGNLTSSLDTPRYPFSRDASNPHHCVINWSDLTAVWHRIN